MGWAVWIDEQEGTAWAQGTHEYRPTGTAVISVTDQFRLRDFRPTLKRPIYFDRTFRGFFGSLEEVNRFLRRGRKKQPRRTPAWI